MRKINGPSILFFLSIAIFANHSYAYEDWSGMVLRPIQSKDFIAQCKSLGGRPETSSGKEMVQIGGMTEFEYPAKKLECWMKKGKKDAIVNPYFKGADGTPIKISNPNRERYIDKEDYPVAVNTYRMYKLFIAAKKNKNLRPALESALDKKIDWKKSKRKQEYKITSRSDSQDDWSGMVLRPIRRKDFAAQCIKVGGITWAPEKLSKFRIGGLAQFEYWTKELECRVVRSGHIVAINPYWNGEDGKPVTIADVNRERYIDVVDYPDAAETYRKYKYYLEGKKDPQKRPVIELVLGQKFDWSKKKEKDYSLESVAETPPGQTWVSDRNDSSGMVLHPVDREAFVLKCRKEGGEAWAPIQGSLYKIGGMESFKYWAKKVECLMDAGDGKGKVHVNPYSLGKNGKPIPIADTNREKFVDEMDYPVVRSYYSLYKEYLDSEKKPIQRAFFNQVLKIDPKTDVKSKKYQSEIVAETPQYADPLMNPITENPGEKPADLFAWHNDVKKFLEEHGIGGFKNKTVQAGFELWLGSMTGIQELAYYTVVKPLEMVYVAPAVNSYESSKQFLDIIAKEGWGNGSQQYVEQNKAKILGYLETTANLLDGIPSVLMLARWGIKSGGTFSPSQFDAKNDPTGTMDLAKAWLSLKKIESMKNGKSKEYLDHNAAYDKMAENLSLYLGGDQSKYFAPGIVPAVVKSVVDQYRNKSNWTVGEVTHAITNALGQVAILFSPAIIGEISTVPRLSKGLELLFREAGVLTKPRSVYELWKAVDAVKLTSNTASQLPQYKNAINEYVFALLKRSNYLESGKMFAGLRGRLSDDEIFLSLKHITNNMKMSELNPKEYEIFFTSLHNLMRTRKYNIPAWMWPTKGTNTRPSSEDFASLMDKVTNESKVGTKTKVVKETKTNTQTDDVTDATYDVSADFETSPQPPVSNYGLTPKQPITEVVSTNLASKLPVAYRDVSSAVTQSYLNSLKIKETQGIALSEQEKQIRQTISIILNLRNGEKVVTPTQVVALDKATNTEGLRAEVMALVDDVSKRELPAAPRGLSVEKYKEYFGNYYAKLVPLPEKFVAMLQEAGKTPANFWSRLLQCEQEAAAF